MATHRSPFPLFRDLIRRRDRSGEVGDLGENERFQGEEEEGGNTVYNGARYAQPGACSDDREISAQNFIFKTLTFSLGHLTTSNQDLPLLSQDHTDVPYILNFLVCNKKEGGCANPLFLYNPGFSPECVLAVNMSIMQFSERHNYPRGASNEFVRLLRIATYYTNINIKYQLIKRGRDNRMESNPESITGSPSQLQVSKTDPALFVLFSFY